MTEQRAGLISLAIALGCVFWVMPALGIDAKHWQAIGAVGIGFAIRWFLIQCIKPATRDTDKGDDNAA